MRLPEEEIRSLKILAATRGVTIKQAVHDALAYWSRETRRRASQRKPSNETLDILQGSLGAVDIEGLRRTDRAPEAAKERHWSV